MNIEAIVEKLSLEEKCQLLVGFDSWHTFAYPNKGVEELMMADGPHGLRKQIESANSIAINESYPATCFPPAVTLAASFDPTLVFEVAKHIGLECRSKEVHAILGPGLNIKRSPLCGRNFEYYSEDPIVSGQLAKAFVQGVQSVQVGACLKHFALNNQETYRMTSSSIADERAIREIYTRGFELALEANPAMVMCSYNKIDGTYASENKPLLVDLLRKTFGYMGVIVSDWTAVSNRVNALLATLDLEMPGHRYSIDQLMHAFGHKLISEEDINHSVRRLLHLILTYTNQPFIEVDLESHHRVASKAYEDCIVLLKNEDDTLPLPSNQTLGLFGELARHVRYQGGGSSNVQPTKIESLFELMHDVAFCAGYQLTNDGFDQVLIDEAISLAKRVDVAIVVVGLTDQYESEGYDRTHLDLPLGHTRLIEAISAVNPNTIVILQIGSPVVMPWLSKVKAVVNGYLGGQAGHVGMYRILKGLASPSGRLAETFPIDLTTHPSNRFFAKGNHQVHYQESIYVGYRYYSTKGSEVLFPFGYGLSYSTFEYSNLVVDKHLYSPGNPLEVRVTVKNTGKVEAKEVVMLFIKRPDAPIFGPIRELKQFQKITLAPQESKEVLFIITNQDVCFFHASIHQWDIFPGKAIIEIMKNANECLLSEEIEIVTKSPLELDSSLSQLSSYQASDLSFTKEDFEQLLGKKLEPASVTIKRPFVLDHTLEDIQSTFIGKIFVKQVMKLTQKTIQEKDVSYQEMVKKSLMQTPLRSIAIFSGGTLSMYQLQGILHLINHRIFKGIYQLLRKKP